MWFLLAILLIPLIEIALFVQIGGSLGVGGTLLEVCISGLAGLLIMRAEPHRNSAEIRAALQNERSPASPMAHSALRIIAAALLLVPGFFTDLAGLVLLIPAVRQMILVQVLSRVAENSRAQGRSQQAGVTIIDADYESHSDPAGPDGPHLPPKDGRNG